MSRKRNHEEMNQSASTDRTLHCVCKTPEDPEKIMVRCDLCDDWFHPSCVNLDEEEAKNIAKWFCPGCCELMKINPLISKKGLLSFQGRVAPTTGWGEDFPIEDIDESVLDFVKTKRHRVEGWTLFREGKITGLSSTTTGNLIYFRGQCQAAMKQKTYNIYMCLKHGGTKLKWGTCSCPAGIDGQCKHLVATLFCLIDFHRQDVKTMPDVKTCTDKLQLWHVRKPTSDEPLLFRDINFVKHDPFKTVKKDLCAAAATHNPVPEFARSVTGNDLTKLVNLFDASGLNLPVLDTIRENNFKPVACRQRCDVNLDADLFEMVDNTSFSEIELPQALKSDIQQHYLVNVSVDTQRAKFIEKNTRLQSKTSFWFNERQYRITASNFGVFCRLKNTTDPVNTFQQKKKFFTSKSVRHGINYEAQALALYQKEKPCASSPVGLVVNPKLPHLGVTPDRLVKVNNEIRLVEIKCPYSVFKKKTSILSQMKEKNFYLEKNPTTGEIQLKKSHDYFYQVQGQLNLCGIEKCDFVVFVPPEDIAIVEIHRDSEFFCSNMLPKLNSIYFSHLLPHFVDCLRTKDQ
ncbi:uncharacterized protein LOC117345238 [Pecten maximus]|uniref:uncharacterized protein LOC117315370 n=1 Tax=Pecten maximus TaxID=6579 RepID=UPI00145843F0|nr:uncharacterized protein LOC117315370 [Pecten maximus]XP_033730881.1 uncharacterized protein LOC117320381 [Pecten maximus]XP_033743959.1 uncharacterized protein LOC117329874 [Pecten maximus]XP_033764155.1 uncharacterized protein LOC117345238 [Pecten maximus]